MSHEETVDKRHPAVEETHSAFTSAGHAFTEGGKVARKGGLVWLVGIPTLTFLETVLLEVESVHSWTTNPLLNLGIDAVIDAAVLLGGVRLTHRIAKRRTHAHRTAFNEHATNASAAAGRAADHVAAQARQLRSEGTVRVNRLGQKINPRRQRSN